MLLRSPRSVLPPALQALMSRREAQPLPRAASAHLLHLTHRLSAGPQSSGLGIKRDRTGRRPGAGTALNPLSLCLLFPSAGPCPALGCRLLRGSRGKGLGRCRSSLPPFLSFALSLSFPWAFVCCFLVHSAVQERQRNTYSSRSSWRALAESLPQTLPCARSRILPRFAFLSLCWREISRLAVHGRS